MEKEKELRGGKELPSELGKCGCLVSKTSARFRREKETDGRTWLLNSIHVADLCYMHGTLHLVNLALNSETHARNV